MKKNKSSRSTQASLSARPTKRLHEHGLQHAPVLLDIDGLHLSKIDRSRLSHVLTGGVILFARNYQSKEQLSALCASIREIKPDALICVDQEGGRVQRCKTDGFTPLPSMAALGSAWYQAPQVGDTWSGLSTLRATSMAWAVGYVMASELRSCGVDLSFAPVLDLNHGGSTVIGDRSFDRDPRVVSLLAQSVMHGMRDAGMANCGKHFPGHGFVRADSHVDMPVDDRAYAQMATDDMLPYGVLSGSLMSIMPAHVIYPSVDSRACGFSSKWLQAVLRDTLGFTGAIVSDDLSMQGAREIEGQACSYAQAAVHALNAGCDLLLLCNQSVIPEGEKSNKTLDHFLDDLTRSLLRQEWLESEESELRRRALLGVGPAKSWWDLVREPRYIQAMELLAQIPHQ
jgi:beta-N-acetylhexosaminidase